MYKRYSFHFFEDYINNRDKKIPYHRTKFDREFFYKKEV